jgi:hypothetical protein
MQTRSASSQFLYSTEEWIEETSSGVKRRPEAAKRDSSLNKPFFTGSLKQKIRCFQLLSSRCRDIFQPIKQAIEI